jgi:hypothetical protein
MLRAKVVWSPVETQYLKDNLEKTARDQLCIALSKSRSALDKKIKELNGTATVSNKSVQFQSKVGHRIDLALFVRSGWEANCLRLFRSGLHELKSPEYEPQTFSFTEHVPPKGAALSYTPDFRVMKGKKKMWVEVKGNWLRGTDKTKMRRFKKYYPEEFENLICIVSSKNTKTAKWFLEELGVKAEQVIEYNQLKKTFSKQIKHWED